MPETGVSQEAGIGEIPFLSGFQMIWKKSFVLDLSKNSKSFPGADQSLTYTERALIISLSHPRKEKVPSRESQKYLTAGLKVVPCLSLRVITHFLSTTRNS